VPGWRHFSLFFVAEVLLFRVRTFFSYSAPDRAVSSRLGVRRISTFCAAGRIFHRIFFSPLRFVAPLRDARIFLTGGALVKQLILPPRTLSSAAGFFSPPPSINVFSLDGNPFRSSLKVMAFSRSRSCGSQSSSLEKSSRAIGLVPLSFPCPPLPRYLFSHTGRDYSIADQTSGTDIS